MNDNMGKKTAVDVTLTVGAAGVAVAQTTPGPDLSSITSAMAIGIVNIGIVSVGTVKIVPNVMKRAVNELVDFLR